MLSHQEAQGWFQVGVVYSRLRSFQWFYFTFCIFQFANVLFLFVNSSPFIDDLACSYVLSTYLWCQYCGSWSFDLVVDRCLNSGFIYDFQPCYGFLLCFEISSLWSQITILFLASLAFCLNWSLRQNSMLVRKILNSYSVGLWLVKV